MKKNGYLLLGLISAFLSCKSDLPHLQAVEDRFQLTTSAQLQNENYSQRIEEFYKGGQEGTFKGEKEVPIYYKIFEHQKGASAAILISAGRTEAAIKYKELIFDLYNNGYAVYIHDHRGQGLSGRMTRDPEMGYIDTFQFYINDMKYFYNEFLKPRHYEKTYLLAHSMGGAIGMTYIQQYAGDFNAAAFSSPMMGLKPPTCAVASVLGGMEPRYAPGQSGYNSEENVFENNTLTGSEIRFQRAVAAFEQVPEARLGGVSVQWVQSSCKQFEYMFEHIENIKTPFILFSAEDEQVVNPGSHHKFIHKALQLNKDCKAYLIENAKHELLVEKDEQRTEVINAALSFFSGY